MISFFQKNGFKFFFSPNENPPHVIITRNGGEMIVWLDPVSIGLSHNLNNSDQDSALKVVRDNNNYLLCKWKEWQEAAEWSAA